MKAVVGGMAPSWMTAEPLGGPYGKQSPLLFIEQAIEQQDGSLELIRRCLENGGMDAHRNGLSTAAG